MEKFKDYNLDIGDVFTLSGRKYEIKVVEDTSMSELDLTRIEEAQTQVTNETSPDVNDSNNSQSKMQIEVNLKEKQYIPFEISEKLIYDNRSMDGYNSNDNTIQPNTINNENNHGSNSNQEHTTTDLHMPFILPFKVPLYTHHNQVTVNMVEQNDSNQSDVDIISVEEKHNDNSEETRIGSRRSNRKRKNIDYQELDDGKFEELLNKSMVRSVSSSESPPKVKKSDIHGVIRLFNKSKFSSEKKTLILYHNACLEHRVPEWHNEKPERLQSIIHAIEELKTLYSDYLEINSGNFDKCDLDIVYKCHEKKYLERILSRLPKDREDPPLHASMSFTTQEYLDDFDKELILRRRDSSLQDTFVSFGSWDAALYASGSVCRAIDEVMNENSKIINAFCAVRPPGHHAGRKGHARAMTQGYCIINNVAIGCFYALEKYNLKKIAVFDFDVHQGNGTQEIVENDERILFISMHGSKIYPFTGEEGGEPWNETKNQIINIGYDFNTKSKNYMELFNAKVITALNEFQPELILLSAGFDAHQQDPTRACKLNIKDYITITREIKKVASQWSKGRIVSVLEGGYDIIALKKCVTSHICALMED